MPAVSSADRLRPASTDALIVVDVQPDFCPGGALAVSEGDAVVPVVNRVMDAFATVILTQDWHPAGHGSFASSHPGRAPFETIDMPYGPQVLWPDHCVQGTAGAALHPDLHTEPGHIILRKGMSPDLDSYSAFFENDHRTTTGLGGWLRDKGVRRVVCCGLATDFCVFYTAMDARALDLDVILLEDACRGIDMDGSVEAAMTRMRSAGVIIAPSSAIGV